MRLLTGREIRKEKTRKENDAALQSKKVADETNKIVKEFNEIRRIVDAKAKELHLEHEASKSRLEKDITDLKGEVASLERRKEEALAPIIDRIRAVKAAETQLEYDKETLQEREKDIAEKRSQAQKELVFAQEIMAEARVSAMKSGEKAKELAAREAQIGSDELNLIFLKDHIQKEKEISERKLADALNMVMLRESVVNSKMAWIESQNQVYADKEKRIRSQQSMLAAAFDEARQLGIIR